LGVVLFVRMLLRLLLSLSQDLLDCLLLLQQESSHDADLDAVGTGGSSVHAADLALALLQGMVLCRSDVLDSLQCALAVAASWSLGGLLNFLCHQLATWGPDRAGRVCGSVVGMTSNACPTRIRHGEWMNESKERRRRECSCLWQKEEEQDVFVCTHAYDEWLKKADNVSNDFLLCYFQFLELTTKASWTMMMMIMTIILSTVPSTCWSS